MKNRLLPVSLALAFACFITGITYYLSIPVHSITPPVPGAEKPAASIASHEGMMEVVMTPPKTFNGRLSPEATSMEAFSSNPKRDPEEQHILDLAIDKNVPDRNKVAQLLAMIPKLPPDAQTLAMENATALIPDSEYLNYRGHLLQLAQSVEMRESVMNDSLTRGEEIRLPNLLEMMRTSTNEQEKREIREIFEAYLDKDYGPNPAHWEAPLRQWVAAHSDN